MNVPKVFEVLCGDSKLFSSMHVCADADKDFIVKQGSELVAHVVEAAVEKYDVDVINGVYPATVKKTGLLGCGTGCWKNWYEEQKTEKKAEELCFNINFFHRIKMRNVLRY